MKYAEDKQTFITPYHLSKYIENLSKWTDAELLVQEVRLTLTVVQL